MWTIKSTIWAGFAYGSTILKVPVRWSWYLESLPKFDSNAIIFSVVIDHELYNCILDTHEPLRTEVPLLCRNGTLKDPDYVNAVASIGLLITVN